LKPFVSLKDIVVEATFSSSQGFILSVSLKQPSFELFDLFNEVIVFGGNRTWTLHHSLELLF
jgi:hypothetical protein